MTYPEDTRVGEERMSAAELVAVRWCVDGDEHKT